VALAKAKRTKRVFLIELSANGVPLARGSDIGHFQCACDSASGFLPKGGVGVCRRTANVVEDDKENGKENRESHASSHTQREKAVVCVGERACGHHPVDLFA